MNNWMSFNDLPTISDYRVVNEATDARDPNELERLSRHPDPNVRARVAENIRTPIDVLERLAEETGEHSDYIKHYLIRNPIVPFHILRKMMNVTDKTLKNKIFMRLLEGYKKAKVDMEGEEVYRLLRELAPDMGDLELIELLETIHELRDAELRKKV